MKTSCQFEGSTPQQLATSIHESTLLRAQCFQTVVLEKIPESPLDCKEIQPISPKGNQPWIRMRRTDAEAPIFWPPDAKSRLTGKDPNAGKDWRRKEKRMRWLERITDSMGMNLSKLQETGEDRGAWCAAVHEVAYNLVWHNWATKQQEGALGTAPSVSEMAPAPQSCTPGPERASRSSLAMLTGFQIMQPKCSVVSRRRPQWASEGSLFSIKDAKGRGPGGTTRAARVTESEAEFSPSTTSTDLGEPWVSHWNSLSLGLSIYETLTLLSGAPRKIMYIGHGKS